MAMFSRRCSRTLMSSFGNLTLLDPSRVLENKSPMETIEDERAPEMRDEWPCSFG